MDSVFIQSASKVDLTTRRRNQMLRMAIDKASKNVSVSAWCTSDVKRWVDALLALIGVILLSPIFIVIAIAIKLDSKGSIFFVQYRTGFMGRRFKFYKFRTMVHNAEALKYQLAHLNKHQSGSIDFKIEKDPRITRVGNFLRRTSLDELPNLFSVLAGDLRLVGPRPTSFCALNYDDEHLQRLLVYPGITGVWQISGRSNVDFNHRVKLDMSYATKASFWLDFVLLLKTPISVFKQEGAA